MSNVPLEGFGCVNGGGCGGGDRAGRVSSVTAY